MPKEIEPEYVSRMAEHSVIIPIQIQSWFIHCAFHLCCPGRPQDDFMLFLKKTKRAFK